MSNKNERGSTNASHSFALKKRGRCRRLTFKMIIFEIALWKRASVCSSVPEVALPAEDPDHPAVVRVHVAEGEQLGVLAPGEAPRGVVVPGGGKRWG